MTKLSAEDRAIQLVGRSGVIWDRTLDDGIKLVAEQIKAAEKESAEEMRERAAKVVRELQASCFDSCLPEAEESIKNLPLEEPNEKA